MKKCETRIFRTPRKQLIVELHNHDFVNNTCTKCGLETNKELLDFLVETGIATDK